MAPMRDISKMAKMTPNDLLALKIVFKIDFSGNLANYDSEVMSRTFTLRLIFIWLELKSIILEISKNLLSVVTIKNDSKLISFLLS